jgi:hypothetical protein
MVHTKPYAALFLIISTMTGICGCTKRTPELSVASATENVNNKIRFDRHIVVDQFGYRPPDSKIAVIRNPHSGYDSLDTFVPGNVYQVRRVDNGESVFSGRPLPWRDGAIQASSGDSGWWFDFSSVTAAGKYVIYDVDKQISSPSFHIKADIYDNILRAAVRTYFYQRSGFEKKAPYADKCWGDAPAYVGKGQDLDAKDITDPNNATKNRDLSGGWFDAGDTNKYVTNAVQPVHQLLNAYRDNPAAFTDDFNIPESGNGVPDLLDEVQWELDWLKKMQYPDGSVALKVGATVYVPASPPSSDRSPRYYVPACTSSTIATAGMFAHASLVLSDFPQLADAAADFKQRAVTAWDNYHRTATKQTDCDTGVVHAGDADLNLSEQNALAAEASIYLFAATHDRAYEQYLQQHYRELQPYHDIGWSRYHADQGEALLFYTTLGNATPEFSARILADKRNDIGNAHQIYGFDPNGDLYRAFLDDSAYHWGSNNPRANYGNTNVDAIKYHIDDAAEASLRARALDTLHYFHGVNPLGMVYLSNMYPYGATQSANEIYHSWFWRNTKWSNAKTSACGPAPGFVTGGPNVNAARDGVPTYLHPPTGQPPQKSYKDWNVASPESSWSVTEPGIYFQAAYIKLLSAFVR